MLDIAIIGGGPVGLCMAANLAKIVIDGKKVRVVVFEKRAEYTRKQILLLSPQSMASLPVCAKNALFGPDATKPGCGRLPPAKDKFSRCYIDIANLSTAVRTSDLEKALACVKSLDNVVLRKPIMMNGYSYNHTTKKHTLTYERKNGDIRSEAFDVIVGADGAASWVRTHILRSTMFPNRNLSSQRIRYGAVFNFDKTPRNEGIFKKVTSAHVARVEAADVQNDYRFFRGRGIYYIGKEVTKSQSDEINSGVLSLEMKNDLQRICVAVTPVGKGCDFTKMTNMASFPITPMRSRTFSDGRGVFLVGDAAMTTHYFTGTGYNIGMETAMNLVSYLQRGRIPSKTTYHRDMMHYVKLTAQKINGVIGATAKKSSA